MITSNNCETENTCVEGCFCPEGLVTNSEGICVKQNECDCYIDDKFYPNQVTVERECESCQCLGGMLNCVPVNNCTCDKVKEFTCVNENNKCIPVDFLCDNSFDCADKSDEANCTCSIDAFVCANGQCVGKYKKCDGFPDCRDASDELDCDDCIEFKCIVNDKCIPSK